MIEVWSKYPYLLMLMKLRPRDLDNYLEMTNTRMDEDNGRSMGMVKGRDC